MNLDDELIEDEEQRVYLPDGEPFTGEAFQLGAGGGFESLAQYRDGYVDGYQRTWRADGSLESEIVLALGEPVGTATKWHRSGQLAEERVFSSDHRLLSLREWDAEGNLLRETS